MCLWLEHMNTSASRSHLLEDVFMFCIAGDATWRWRTQSMHPRTHNKQYNFNISSQYLTNGGVKCISSMLACLACSSSKTSDAAGALPAAWVVEIYSSPHPLPSKPHLHQAWYLAWYLAKPHVGAIRWAKGANGENGQISARAGLGKGWLVWL